MTETNNSSIESQENVKELSKGVFSFTANAGLVLKTFKEQNHRLAVTKGQLVNLFTTFDALNALPHNASTVVVGGVSFDISEYQIPAFMSKYILPKHVSFTGRTTSPDILRRAEGDLKLNSAEANRIVNLLCKYLRVPTEQFVRKDETTLGGLAEGTFTIGDKWIMEESGFDKLCCTIKPEAIVAKHVWGEDAFTGQGVKMIGINFRNDLNEIFSTKQPTV